MPSEIAVLGIIGVVLGGLGLIQFTFYLVFFNAQLKAALKGEWYRLGDMEYLQEYSFLTGLSLRAVRVPADVMQESIRKTHEDLKSAERGY